MSISNHVSRPLPTLVRAETMEVGPIVRDPKLLRPRQIGILVNAPLTLHLSPGGVAYNIMRRSRVCERRRWMEPQLNPLLFDRIYARPYEYLMRFQIKKFGLGQFDQSGMV